MKKTKKQHDSTTESAESRRRFLKRGTALAALPATAALESCVCPAPAKRIRVDSERAFPKGTLDHGAAVRRTFIAGVNPAENPPGNSTHAEGQQLAVWTLERLIHDIKRILTHGKPQNGGTDVPGGGSMQDVHDYIAKQEAVLTGNQPRKMGAMIGKPTFIMRDSKIVGVVIQGCVLLQGKHTVPANFSPITLELGYSTCAEVKKYYDTHKDDHKFRTSGGGGAVTSHLVYSSSSSSSSWGI